ncbi:MAG: hypothetical protein DMG05_25910 [Acidobacteria bacterium]|nr:MAG: hypothetical protein DMG05_25910 [Acidobacteriota bacterium]
MSINRETQSLDRSVGQLWEWLAGREFVRPLSGFETLSADCSWTHRQEFARGHKTLWTACPFWACNL